MASQRGRVERVSVVRLGPTYFGAFTTHWLLNVLIGLLAVFSGLDCSASTRYAYDANGRLVAVTNDEGESARYVYDAMGNIIRIERIPAGELRIFGITPSHGAYEAEVALTGQGFSSVLEDNAVSFNGTPAAVRSASTSQLKVNVPNGATTGPVSVTVGARSVASDAPFIVDETGVPPSIASVAPITVAPGMTLDINGAHLYPIPNKTSLRLGGRSLSPDEISNAHASVAITGTSTSGTVTVQTPYGQVESAETILVVPPGLKPSDIAMRAVASVDSPPVSLTLAKGQLGAVLFESNQNDWLSLQATNVSSGTNTVSYKIYAPGSQLVQTGTISTSAPTIHLPRLNGAGTYLAIFTASTAATQFSIGLESNPFLARGKLTELASAVATQSKRAVFFARAGEAITFQEPFIQTVPVNASVRFRIVSPSGVFVSDYVTSMPKTINLFALPETGTYQIIVLPSVGQTVTTQVGVLPGVVAKIIADAPLAAVDALVPDQAALLKFTATSHQNLQLILTGVTQEGAAAQSYAVVVLDATGHEVGRSSCVVSSPLGNCFLYLWNLAQGDYSVQVTTANRSIIHFHTAIRTQLMGRQLRGGIPLSVSLDLGQTERMTFDAEAGQSVALQVSSIASSPSGQLLNVFVYRPDSPAITTTTSTYTTIQPTSSQIVNLSNLPVTGRYTVILAPRYGVPLSAQVELVPGATGNIPVGQEASSYEANAQGQNIYLSFENGDERADLELTLSNVRVAGGQSANYTVNVYNESNVQVYSTSCSTSNPGSGCRLPLWYLARGRYSVIVSPGSGSLLQFNASVKHHRVGKVLSLDQPVDLSFGIGEAERLTFDANAGDTVALRVASVATNPAGKAVTIGIYRPDAGAITTSTTTYTTLAPTGTQIVNLPNLPVSGRYTVIVAPQYGLPAAVNLSLVSGSTGHLVAGAGAQLHGAHVPGQNIYLTFDATEREDLEFSISGFSAVGGQSSSYTVNVYSATGTQIFSSSCSAGNPGAGCRLPLWYLPAGRYSVVVAPTGGAELHFATTLNDVRVGRELLPDVAADFTFGTAEAERVTFSASAGDSVSLQVSDLLTVPAGSLINVYVYRPDDGAISSTTTPYVLAQPLGNKVVNLPNLPVTGRYKVIVAPGYGLPGRVTLTMTRTSGNPVPPGEGTLPSDGLPHSQSAAVGQSVTMTFASVLGDNYELTLNRSMIGGGTAGSLYVNVLGPSGASVSTATCYPSDPGGGCRMPLWNLATGVYTVVVSASNKNATSSFVAILRKEAIEGILERGRETDVSLSDGQVRRFAFDAALGDTVALRLFNIGTTPAGRFVTVQIYRPDTGRIVAGAPYASLAPTAYGTLNLSELPVGGRYVAVVSSPFGIPATASLLLTSGVSGIQLKEGIAQAVTTTVGGQNAYMTFDVARGDNLELALSGTTITGSSATNMSVQVMAPNGTSVANFTCYSSDPTGSCRQPIWNLVPGSYTIIASAPNSASIIGFTAKLTRDLDSGQLTRDVAVDASLEQGQVKRFMFAASAGDTVALRLDGATLPAGRQITAQVYRPDGGAIRPGESYSSLPITVRGVLNLPDLPASGNYSVVVSSAFGLPANATLALASGAGGTVLSPDVTQQVATHIEGQSAYLDFDASYGDNMQVSLSDTQIIGGASTFLNVNVFNPSGTNVASFTCTARIGASCRYPLWNLTKGKYRVIVSPADISAKLMFSVLLRQEVVSGSIPRNQPIEVPLEMGQVKRMILDAQEGESLTVAVDAIASSPAGKAVTVQIFSPDDGQVLPGGAYKSVSTSDSSTMSIPSLPASGSYLVIFSSADGVPATVGISVTSP